MFLFGSEQQHNACALSEEDAGGVSLLNGKVREVLENEDARIVDVHLGWNNTQIVVSEK